MLCCAVLCYILNLETLLQELSELQQQIQELNDINSQLNNKLLTAHTHAQALQHELTQVSLYLRLCVCARACVLT